MKPQKPIWYVILEKFIPVEGTMGIFTVTRHRREMEFRFAYTRQWARDQARVAQREGWTVVDICKGTKTHINHKYQGL